MFFQQCSHPRTTRLVLATTAAVSLLHFKPWNGSKYPTHFPFFFLCSSWLSFPLPSLPHILVCVVCPPISSSILSPILREFHESREREMYITNDTTGRGGRKKKRSE